MSEYPDLSALDIHTATDGLLSQMFVVREGTPKPWEQEISELHQSTQLADGSWAHVWGNGPPVLFAHGFEGRYSQFARIIERSSESGFKLVCLEMPGHGRNSSLRADPLSFSLAIQAASAMFDSFHTMIGHSQGANAVLHAAANGALSNRLILLAPLVSVETNLRQMCAMVKLPPEGVELFLHKVAKLVGVPPSDFEGQDLSATLDLPTLIIHDRNDREVPIAEAEALAAQWPLAHLKISDGLGHRRILADADIVELVFKFLDKTKL